MKKNYKSKLNELGSLMIEAMAMLALISMVTPILYRKAAERTTELEDINAASQMRSLSQALDDYVSDHYDDIMQGKTVTQNCNVASVNYSDLKATAGASTKSKEVDLAHFCEYLPYGFLDASKNTQGTKAFDATYKVSLKKVDGGEGRKRVITAFLVTQPRAGVELSKVRASRIASMIGSNGGYISKDGDAFKGNGAQGIWTVPNIKTDLSITENDKFKLIDGAIMVSSMQGIASQGGAYNENVLYRVNLGKPELNTMTTKLYMGSSPEQSNNIVNVNQMIISAGRPGIFETGTNSADHALYVKKGGASIAGGLKAALTGADGKALFEVTDAGKTTAVEYVAGNFNAKEGVLSLGNVFSATEDGGKVALGHTAGTTAVNVVGADGTLGSIANPVIDVKGDTKISGNLEVTKNTIVGGDLGIGGALNANNLHARNKLTVGGKNPDDPDNLTVTSTEAIFEKGKFVVGGTFDTNSSYNLKIDNNNVNLRASTASDGTTGVLNMYAGNKVDMSTSASGGILISAGNADVKDGKSLVMETSGNAVLRSTGTAGVVTINDTMMKLTKKTTTTGTGGTATTSVSGVIESVVDQFLIKNHSASTYLAAGISAKEVESKDMVYDIQDKDGRSKIILDPSQTAAYAQVEGKLLVKNTKETTTGIGATANTTYSQGSTLFKVDPKNGDVGAVVNITNKKVQMSKDGSDDNRILTVDMDFNDKGGATTATAKDKSSVYIRRGAIEIAPNTTAEYDNPDGSGGKLMSSQSGYIKADRFIDNKAPEAKFLAKPTYTDETVSTGTAYDKYQVNPAYTSVMHDIKLTTRGGARLSDILPDFINKGIYIVDNTYKEKEISGWNKRDTNGYQDGDFDPMKDYETKSCASDHSCIVSPWTGFVPTPTCPPGYMKVVTLTPATFAMAQAGVPGPLNTVGANMPDLIIDYNARNPNDFVDGATPTTTYTTDYPKSAPTPLYFQKNTWLRTMVIPYVKSGFKGWSTVMGFIYPANYYKKYVELLVQRGWMSEPEDWGVPNTRKKMVLWNLFPVNNQTLEGYATVYCYFNRFDSAWDDTLVDTTYDQLGSLRGAVVKNNEKYIKRLNDPKTGYGDPW